MFTKCPHPGNMVNFSKPRRQEDEYKMLMQPLQTVLILLYQLLTLPFCPSYSLSLSLPLSVSLSFPLHQPLCFPIIGLNLRKTIQEKLWSMIFVGNYMLFKAEKTQKEQ